MKGSPQQQKPYSDLITTEVTTGSQSTHKRVSNESLPLGVQLLNRYYQSGAEKMNGHKKAINSTPNTNTSSNQQSHAL